MIIKTDQFELEIAKGSDIYIGSKWAGQAFYKWNEIDDNIKTGLNDIVTQVESLMKDSENLLLIKSVA